MLPRRVRYFIYLIVLLFSSVILLCTWNIDPFLAVGSGVLSLLGLWYAFFMVFYEGYDVGKSNPRKGTPDEPR